MGSNELNILEFKREEFQKREEETISTDSYDVIVKYWNDEGTEDIDVKRYSRKVCI